MTRDEIAAAAANAVGNPTNGLVAEAIATIADAIDGLLNPKPEAEVRVMVPPETR